MTIDVDDLVAGQLLGMLVGALVALGGVAWKRMRDRRGERGLWRLGRSDRLVIAISDSGTSDTGTYLRPMTGLGQVTSVGLLTPTLARAYRNLPTNLVRFASECRDDDVLGDLVILGGPKANRLAARLFERLPDDFPVQMTVTDRTRIHWNGPAGALELPGDAVAPGTSGGKDYGIILRLRNVFDGQDGTITLFAGVHTYGTLAAASYFANSPKDVMAHESRSFAILVSIDVDEGNRPFGPTKLDTLELNDVPR
jgi:hypothetical protein